MRTASENETRGHPPPGVDQEVLAGQEKSFVNEKYCDVKKNAQVTTFFKKLQADLCFAGIVTGPMYNALGKDN
ncbi:MAG: hypothetical protein CMJ21_06680 [Phycisphaerae bacterium]|nr:hypothetical protein [Phycisphaerae bacterium]